MLFQILIFLFTFLCIAAGEDLNSTELSVEVDILDSQRVKVSWQSQDPHLHLASSVEIIYKPLGASYFSVYPVDPSLSTSQVLENLIDFTEYEVVVRAELDTGLTLSSHWVTFDTSRAVRLPGETHISGYSMDNLEIGLICFILLLWLFLIRKFLMRWDKIRRNIPPQPVYSKEMSEKIEMEVEKLRSGNSIDYKMTWSGLTPIRISMARTNSTFLPKQANSLDIDRGALRRTKSEENTTGGLASSKAPMIVIDRVSSPSSVRSPVNPIRATGYARRSNLIGRRLSDLAINHRRKLFLQRDFQSLKLSRSQGSSQSSGETKEGPGLVRAARLVKQSAYSNSSAETD